MGSLTSKSADTRASSESDNTNTQLFVLLIIIVIIIVLLYHVHNSTHQSTYMSKCQTGMPSDETMEPYTVYPNPYWDYPYDWYYDDDYPHDWDYSGQYPWNYGDKWRDGNASYYYRDGHDHDHVGRHIGGGHGGGHIRGHK